jgi:cytoskeleton protein RodZ
MSDATGIDVKGGEHADSRASIGAQLRAARKKRKLEIEEVAQELHLDIGVVRALENDERDKLPAPIFVQGYLKSYGRLVGLPVDKLIKDYSEQMGEPPPLHVIKSAERLPAVSQRSIRLIRYVIVLLLLAILVWLVYPFIERYIDAQREPAGEQVPGHLELPPASELVRDRNLQAATDALDDPVMAGRSDTYIS